jgi:hypothetical protein
MTKFLMAALVLGSSIAQAAPGHHGGRDRRPSRPRPPISSEYGDVQLERLSTGDPVATNDGYTGTVIGIFGDRDVSVKTSYGNKTYERRNVAGPGCSLRACDGQAGYSRDGYTGTIIGIFPSGAVSLKTSYGVKMYERIDLAAAGCAGAICDGDTVSTRDGYNGTVSGVFPNSDISIKTSYGQKVYPYNDVAAPSQGPIGRHDGIDRDPRTGEQAYSHDGYTGTVIGVMGNGDVSLKTSYGNKTYSRGNIAVEGCFRRVCSGDQVATRDGYNGVVSGIFPSGAVSIKTSYGQKMYAYDDVAAPR